MDPRELSALLSSLVSQLLLLLLLLFNSSNSNHRPVSDANLFSIIHYLLSSQEIAASLSFVSVSRKRKRTHCQDSDSGPIGQDVDPELGRRLGGDLLRLGLTRNPDSFKSCFRMKSSTFEWLAGLLEPLLECRDPVGTPLNLSAELRLGIGLFRLATGSSYPEIAQRFGVSESVTRFCAKHLCRVLCTNFRFWVAFPSPEELKSVSLSFEQFTGLPNCCGVIDCTRFNIVNENNGGIESIAAQVVVDSSSRILSIIAGFKGDKGDSRILKSSTLYKDIEEGRLLNSSPVVVNGVAVNQYLVGDGKYPLLPWLMVPFADVFQGSSEGKFNVAHRAMRVSALKTIASLKNWGILNKPMQEEFKAAVAVIGACSILHNVLLMREDDSALCEMVGDYSVDDQSSKYCVEASLEEDSIGKQQASVIRDALAAEVREVHVSSLGGGSV
ncbi:Harbinger transposase-derived nuclease [Corchorus olitorius]|uniref:Harbinger transposase-derived nuclease n=1 Tax=Corchorus olitorius TaxID=93759 RepID=A0A1R3GYS8_9ROSI|nr:Harbinger transposase-derived nuclease [Corchorus olitorius]